MISINPGRLVVAVLCAGLASAEFSMYIPGMDPQPISASEIGVDGQGRTSWLITPMTTDEEAALLGPATVVEGPNDAVLTYALGPLNAGIDCTYSGNLAICTAVVNGQGEPQTATQTETIVSFAVQGGPTGSASAPAPTDATSGSLAPTDAPSGSPGSSASGADPASNPGSASGPSATDGATPSPSAEGTNANAGVKEAVSKVLLGLGVVGGLALSL